ncbi:MAG: TylF/MycF family methyltransferase [Trichlorobacter sp.]|uniref:TylF/MycF/NovP-related O-methyltransferase n=1 Tax=Trichlorobacter sp. TaxID=2911007 RepID=UPI00256B22AC|nr:TylF/MycF/NovP-related O-methyltransferase [Trichlorobacter sp.]MDK9717033.1 TylF/MycF family methyltransferase [Trichlorobacter sp.]
MNLAQRYLDIMKKCLSFTLWKEPLIPFDYLQKNNLLEAAQLNVPQGQLGQVRELGHELSKVGLELAVNFDPDDDLRQNGGYWPYYADTMIGLKRLDNIQFCMEYVLNHQIPGDFIETGVWRGGACIFMRAVLEAYGIKDRMVYVADSFKGLPPPETGGYTQDRGDILHSYGYLAVSKNDVQKRFYEYGLLDKQVAFLEGWFSETLPSAPITKLSVLRLDGDMYASTMDVLTSLYEKLSDGGFCIVDDYTLEGCRKAIEDFRASLGISSPLVPIDPYSVYWQKGVF